MEYARSFSLTACANNLKYYQVGDRKTGNAKILSTTNEIMRIQYLETSSFKRAHVVVLYARVQSAVPVFLFPAGLNTPTTY